LNASLEEVHEQVIGFPNIACVLDEYLPFEKDYSPDSNANSWFRSAFGVD